MAAFNKGHLLTATLVILRKRCRRRKKAAATLLNKNKEPASELRNWTGKSLVHLFQLYPCQDV